MTIMFGFSTPPVLAPTRICASKVLEPAVKPVIRVALVIPTLGLFAVAIVISETPLASVAADVVAPLTLKLK